MKKRLFFILVVVLMLIPSISFARNPYNLEDSTSYLLYSINKKVEKNNVLDAYYEALELVKVLEMNLKKETWCHGQTPWYYEREYERNKYDVDRFIRYLENYHESRYPKRNQFSITITTPSRRNKTILIDGSISYYYKNGITTIIID